MARPDAQAPPPSPPGVSQANIAITQGKVIIAKDVMAANLQAAVDRGEKVADLSAHALQFEDQAGMFLDGGKKVHRKQRLSKYKWYLVCGLLAAVLCSGIIVAIVVVVKGKN